MQNALTKVNNSMPTVNQAFTFSKKYDYINDSVAENTKKAYKVDRERYETWCDLHELAAYPATIDMICAYVEWLAFEAIRADGQKGYKAATIQRNLVTIKQAHDAAGYASPTQSLEFRKTFQAIKRRIGTAQRQAGPATIKVMKQFVGVLDNSLIDIRDRAILLLSFFMGARRSEIAALNIEDIRFIEGEGMQVTIRKSKTDQYGAGRVVNIPLENHPEACATRWVKRWLKESGITTGALFRPISKHGKMGNKHITGHGIALIAKRTAEKAGFDPDEFSGHSFRRGFIVEARNAGKTNTEIMAQTGHRNSMMIDHYAKQEGSFVQNAARGLWR